MAATFEQGVNGIGMSSVLHPAARSAVLALTALLGTMLPAPLSAETVEEKAQLCAACHGENGIPQQTSTPVIWGQYQGYLYLELRDYKTGARKNDIMASTPRAIALRCRRPRARARSARCWSSRPVS